LVCANAERERESEMGFERGDGGFEVRIGLTWRDRRFFEKYLPSC